MWTLIDDRPHSLCKCEGGASDFGSYYNIWGARCSKPGVVLRPCLVHLVEDSDGTPMPYLPSAKKVGEDIRVSPASGVTAGKTRPWHPQGPNHELA